MRDLHIIVLAAGKGTRMKSARPKVLHELAGLPLIEHVLRTAPSLQAARTVLVVGHGADQIRQALSNRADLDFAVQEPQLGTGHALLQTEPVLGGLSGTALLLYGDVPLLTTRTLEQLLERHHTTGAALTVLTADLPDPYGYGRIVREAGGRIARIVEQRDASPEERAITEVNSGIYALELAPLFEGLHSLATDNTQGEYYLTDLVGVYHRAGRTVETLRLDDPTELRGVNSRLDLSELNRVVLDQRRRELMLGGVTLEDPATTYVDADVSVGEDTTIGPCVTLSGRTSIGPGCHVHAGCRLTDTTLGAGVTVLDHSVLTDSVVGDDASIGPCAHLRPGSRIGDSGKVGNFVELKKTTLGPRSKAPHLSYLGDAEIGADVNIGAGTITCNYDGFRKHRTTIEDGVFVGSDSQLIAPVTLGRGAYVGAGSSITDDVPPDALAIARARQTTRPGWVKKKRGD